MNCFTHGDASWTRTITSLGASFFSNCTQLCHTSSVQGDDWLRPFCFFPCKAEQLHRNLAFGLGPLGLTLHHCCFLACQEGANRNERHLQSVSTLLIILGSQLLKGIYICEEMSKIEKSYFVHVHELSQGTNYTKLGNTINGEIKFSTTWLHLLIDSLIYSRSSY